MSTDQWVDVIYVDDLEWKIKDNSVISLGIMNELIFNRNSNRFIYFSILLFITFS